MTTWDGGEASISESKGKWWCFHKWKMTFLGITDVYWKCEKCGKIGTNYSE